jgi:hypothetical protein
VGLLTSTEDIMLNHPCLTRIALQDGLREDDARLLLAYLGGAVDDAVWHRAVAYVMAYGSGVGHGAPVAVDVPDLLVDIAEDAAREMVAALTAGTDHATTRQILADGPGPIPLPAA